MLRLLKAAKTTTTKANIRRADIINIVFSCCLIVCILFKCNMPMDVFIPLSKIENLNLSFSFSDSTLLALQLMLPRSNS
jgi:hypothetical protein